MTIDYDELMKDRNHSEWDKLIAAYHRQELLEKSKLQTLNEFAHMKLALKGGVGIEPSELQKQRWDDLQDVCFQVIKLAELEKQGIRTGAVEAIWFYLKDAVDALEDAYRPSDDAADEHSSDSAADEEWIPF